VCSYKRDVLPTSTSDIEKGSIEQGWKERVRKSGVSTARKDRPTAARECGASRVFRQSLGHGRIHLYAFRTRAFLHKAMETLTPSSRSELTIPVPGVGKHFEMHPSGPSASVPVTRMTHNHNHDKEPLSSQERVSLSSQSDETGSSVGLVSSLDSHPTSPTHPQEPERPHSQSDMTSSPTRHKRTASGLLKVVDTPTHQRPRAESVSSSGSKAGEVSLILFAVQHIRLMHFPQAAAQLKTRLAYAMVKVQHGWEHRNINEVEQLAAALHPPTAASPPASSAPIDTCSPPSKRRSASGNVSWSLPATKSSSQNSNAFGRSSPSTPKTRPPSIRSAIPTKLAEQDAMDALMLMGASPSNGGRLPLSQSSSTSSHPQSQQDHHCSDSPSMAIGDAHTRPAVLSRSTSSVSDVSVANSEVREARDRVLDEVEEVV
jgi:hypothetical protein